MVTKNVIKVFRVQMFVSSNLHTIDYSGCPEHTPYKRQLRISQGIAQSLFEKTQIAQGYGAQTIELGLLGKRRRRE